MQIAEGGRTESNNTEKERLKKKKENWECEVSWKPEKQEM